MSQLLIIIYFLSIPFYFFNSGLPQISELILCILFFINTKDLLRVIFNKISFIYNLLFLWMALVNVFYYFINQEVEYLTYTIYYVYNGLVVSLFICLLYINESKYLKTIMWGSCLSLVFQLLTSLVYTSDSLRETLFFNNPNQLAYFAIMMSVLILYCNNRLYNSIYVDLLTIMMSGYLILLSASKSAMISLFLITILYLYTRNKKSFSSIVSLITGSFVLCLSYLIFTNNQYLYGIHPQIDFFMSRLFTTSSYGANIIENRGYDRIFEYPQYLMLGAGEGGLERFKTNIELHSTYGTLLFSYGILGILLFTTLLLYIFTNLNFRVTFLLIAPLLYSVTHYGLRESLFWILLSIMLYEIRTKKCNSKNSTSIQL